MNNLALQQWKQLLAAKTSLEKLDDTATAVLETAWQRRHGHFNDWLAAVDDMPSGENGDIDLSCAAPLLKKDLSVDEQQVLQQTLQILMPWRKGPFAPCGIDLDCEWRSDFKYERLKASGIDFSGKHVLDVGCGNGYFMLRMLGDGAALTVGVDPSWHYFAQFLALQKLYQAERIVYLPLTLDDVLLNDMDITMSMGVLYHRRDPMQHLWQLRETLRKGGQMVVETLVVEGDERTVYMPPDRYAGMGNVWFLPSPAALCQWLTRLGLEVEYCSEPVATIAEEQRRTAWMDRFSLDDFMQPDYQATKEGLPPPKRVLIVARKP
ncbi:tRNA 5-methoxyuridine(34)/uridine 5-oxyacetic acid(34) synthase CmoB [Cardiobacteriaceae bacterium TAE3-ERU3]|nr:tRNA 5-methoxyuridine(34)/uridine 5-oxyacetic acid(34) synthase CmoB [Cardiobacteriaceae bacterium TAE3-ERU3]